MVDPKEHILVCQMNHQQGVAAHCPPAAPAHVSSTSHQLSLQTVQRILRNHNADCGMPSLCIQANLVNLSPNTH